LAILIKSINFVVLGKQDIASDFGKKGTVSDISLYDRKESNVIKTWVTPSGFPEKIQPLFQAINLAEYVIFHVDKLDKFTGEQIIALDSLKKEKGLLSHTFEVDESKLDAMIKGTVVEKYTKVDQDKIKEKMDKIEAISNDGPSEMVIDHCFDVKGVGTVILGKVTIGKVKAIKKKGINDVLIVGGGVIPDVDHKDLIKSGVKHVFGPGTPLPTIINHITTGVSKLRKI